MASYRALSVAETQRRQMSLALRYAGLTAAQRAVASQGDRDSLDAASSALAVNVQTMHDAASITPELDRIEAVIERVGGSLGEFDGRFPATGGEFAPDGVVRTVVAHLASPWQRAVLRVADHLVARISFDTLVVDLRAVGHDKLGVTERIDLETVTQTPVTLGPVEARPQRVRDGIARVLGLREEHELGAPAFDGLYWLTGQPDAVRALVTGDVARNLVALAPLSPTLSIDGGHARLAWAAGRAAILQVLRESGSDSRQHAEAMFPRAALAIHSDLRAALTR